MKPMQVILFTFASLMVWLAIDQYLFCPAYSFTRGKPFSGSKLYNPYKGMDSLRWLKCNFHAHTRAWRGITNGHGSPEDLYHAYKSLGYDVNTVSNYEEINTTLQHQVGYVPAYEHGYNLKKVHQLVLGTTRVEWKDFLLPQTIYNKQALLNQISQNAHPVIVLNHPAIRNAYTAEDLSKLGNYQCMEVLNPAVFSFAQWDAALTAGRAVFIMGNDDTHNVNNPSTIGRCCTVVNAPLVCDSILKALRSGNSYAVATAAYYIKIISRNIKGHRPKIPFLKSFTVKNDTIFFQMSEKATQIKLIGQGGRLLFTAQNQDGCTFLFKPDYHYVRAEVYFPDGTSIYLNPVFRYISNPFAQMMAPPIDNAATFSLRFSGVVLLSAWIIFIVRSLQVSKKRKLRLAAAERAAAA